MKSLKFFALVSFVVFAGLAGSRGSAEANMPSAQAACVALRMAAQGCGDTLSSRCEQIQREAIASCQSR
jgi:hypothetical protein